MVPALCAGVFPAGPGRAPTAGLAGAAAGSAAVVPLGSEAPMSPPPLAVVSAAPASIGAPPPSLRPRSSGEDISGLPPDMSGAPVIEAPPKLPGSPESPANADIGDVAPPPIPGDMPPAAWVSPLRIWPAVVPVVAAGAENTLGSTAGRAGGSGAADDPRSGLAAAAPSRAGSPAPVSASSCAPESVPSSAAAVLSLATPSLSSVPVASSLSGLDWSLVPTFLAAAGAPTIGGAGLGGWGTPPVVVFAAAA